ncbi:hypothetical protein GC197_18025 [bacterium]|nr:hypothetical protein [bacterium]
MPIDFDCAVCKHRIRVPDGAEGKRTKCPKCNAIQPVPSESDELRLKDAGEDPFGPGPARKDDPYRPSPPPPPQPTETFQDTYRPEGNNPYASPSTSTSQAAINQSRMEALEKIQTPALIGLILAGLGIACNVIFLVITVINVTAEGVRGGDLVVQLATYAITIGFSIGLLGFAAFGLMQARDLKNYGLAWAGFIITLLPCSCCFPLSLPVSIWGMMVLSDSGVQRQFE